MTKTLAIIFLIIFQCLQRPGSILVYTGERQWTRAFVAATMPPLGVRFINIPFIETMRVNYVGGDVSDGLLRSHLARCVLIREGYDQGEL